MKVLAGILVCCSSFFFVSTVQAALSPYQATLSNSQPWNAASLLVEFTTSKSMAPASTITSYFSDEWYLEPKTSAPLALTVSVNGVTQPCSSVAGVGVFGIFVNGQQAVITTPVDTTFASGTTFAILYGAAGTWYTPSRAGMYPFSTIVKNVAGEPIESGASYVAIIEGISVTSSTATASFASDSHSDAGSDAAEAAATEAADDGVDAQPTRPQSALETAPEAVQDGGLEASMQVDLGGDEGVDAVDVAALVLMIDLPGAEATADFNGDGVVSLQDLGIMLSFWTMEARAIPTFDRFPVGSPLAQNSVSFEMRSMNMLRTSFVQTDMRETLALTVSTGETPINVVDVFFDFDDDLLQVKEIYTDESIISLWAMEPEVIDGTVHFIGTIPGGFSGSGAPLVLIEFAGAVSSLEGAVAFSTKTAAVYDDSAGTLAIVTFSESAATLAAVEKENGEAGFEPSSEAPVIDSQTHPDPYQWYANASPVFFWDRDDGDTGYSYILDHELQTTPDDRAETTEVQVSFNTLQDGEWMLHVRRLCDGCDENTTSHRLLRIDATPPGAFKVETGFAMFLWEEFPFLVFEATDTMSGIAYYEVEAHGERTIVNQGPFILSFERNGWYRVSVVAVDRAGNRMHDDTTVTIGSPALFSFQTSIIMTLLIVGFGIVFLLLTALVVRRHRLRV